MAESAPLYNPMLVELPEPGKVAEFTLRSDVPVVFGFYVSEVVFSSDGNDLVLTGENGGVVIFKDYLIMAREETLPDFELHGGEVVPGSIYLFAFSDGASDVETAAGPDEDEPQSIEVLDQIDSRGGLIPDAEDDSTSDAISILGGHEGDILTYNELFSDGSPDLSSNLVDEPGYLPSLLGAEPHGATVSLYAVTLSDIFDPMDDALQHLVDFHHTL
ncbi:hypothetical protein LF599_11495 [Pseudodesulfovibrio thermohalotolerans]|uniref:hypothetical protein n=1 Tax=Pseudodesulfovibrio thermohalotolerans TaxID=2880651 RepID=UPI002441DF61|nr:hypothetical protein [Pseudodesulfovibrio thermohalotolerans]WFS61296.1 hypothetical protein LF599_11495 [Pseudodesulfovibrio thermohalotolerans]